MVTNEQFMRFLAAWALVHETADEGWKAAVERGSSVTPEAMKTGPEAFVDGLSAIIAEEKDRLKNELAAGGSDSDGRTASEGDKIDELRFEVAELKGRIESMSATLDMIAKRTISSGE